MPVPHPEAPPRRATRGLLALAPAIALVLVALCLRGPFAGVGPVLGELGEELSVSTTTLAVLTSLPLVCLGLLAPLAPVMAARIGLQRALLAGVAVVVVGVAVRLAGVPGLFAGTVLLTGGIAVANVLLPAVARAEYGRRSAAVVGVTTGAVAFSASLGAGLAQPLADATGGAVRGLTLWLVPTLAAAAALLPLALRRPPAGDGPAGPPGARILRDPVALAVTGYFGLQSLAFYAMLTWLPEVLEDEAGVTPVAAGGLLAVAAAMGAPLSLVVPPLAARSRSQAAWVVGASVPTVVALAGLLLAPDAAPVLWALLYGIGTGACFPLAMTLVLVRTRDVAQTGRLSAAAQSAGYLLAAGGPLSIGLLHEATGGWATGLVLLLVLLLAQVAVGLLAARPRLVTEDAPQKG